jgi:hypothetical protein
MSELVVLVHLYESYLQEIKEIKHDDVRRCMLAMKDDEAKFGKVELNIVEIFEKMFSLSAKGLADNITGLNQLEEKYLGHFKRIPTAWEDNLKKCLTFNHHEEAHIERIKLNQAQLLKEKFIELHQEVLSGRTS